jgi:diadenylate cyclase
VIEWVYAWLSDLWSTLSANYHPVWDSLDILLVAGLVYGLMILIRGTRAAQMTLGLLVLVLVWLLSDQLELLTLGFLLENFLTWGVLIVIVIFQADIRRALTRMGRGLFPTAARHEAHAIEEVVRACQVLAQRRVGSLIVIERDISLDEHLELGTRIDAELSRDVLIALFLPYSPLHDGAVIVREGRIAAAGCILPLALRGNLPSALGTRHRAAWGIAEETDALAIVVSEETGRISLVAGGEMLEDLDAPRLRQALLRMPEGHRREEAGAEGTKGAAELPQSS